MSTLTKIAVTYMVLKENLTNGNYTMIWFIICSQVFKYCQVYENDDMFTDFNWQCFREKMKLRIWLLCGHVFIKKIIHMYMESFSTVKRLRLRLQICLNVTSVHTCGNFGFIVYFVEAQVQQPKNNWIIR